ncbi:unnamed protein product [Leptosia nina]|uniref:Uncharacterized protein n=1 Tax=Leptosia nina TaxID=320188 RepID=A0AAV1JI30_9NEOP
MISLDPISKLEPRALESSQSTMLQVVCKGNVIDNENLKQNDLKPLYRRNFVLFQRDLDPNIETRHEGRDLESDDLEESSKSFDKGPMGDQRAGDGHTYDGVKAFYVIPDRRDKDHALRDDEDDQQNLGYLLRLPPRKNRVALPKNTNMSNKKMFFPLFGLGWWALKGLLYASLVKGIEEGATHLINKSKG